MTDFDEQKFTLCTPQEKAVLRVLYSHQGGLSDGFGFYNGEFDGDADRATAYMQHIASEIVESVLGGAKNGTSN